MIKIYGADWCGPCQASKKMCEDLGLEYEFHPFENHQSMFAENGWRSIPQIFVDDEHIGGYTDLVAMYNEE